MRHFDDYASLNAALYLPADAPGAFRFLSQFAPATFQCVDCGPQPLTFGGLTPGYARTHDDKMLCYACADARQRADMASADKFYCYVSSDGKRVTTWTGGELGKVTSYGESRSGWNGGTIAYVRVTDCHGRRWYGRGGGRGMNCSLRRVKGA